MSAEILTQHEYHRIASALNEPQFASLFMEYMDEMTDPKNRMETVEYLKGLESSNEVPEGFCLLQPKPWICLETYFRDSDKGKAFINIGFTDYIETVKIENNKACIPFIAASPKLDKDGNKPCVSVDVVVGQGADHKSAQKNIEVIVAISDVVIDSLNTSHFRRDPISKDVKLRREWKYKDGLAENQIIPMLVRKENLVRIPKCEKSRSNILDAQNKSTTIDIPVTQDTVDNGTFNMTASYTIAESFKSCMSDHLFFDKGELPAGRSPPEKICVTVNLPHVTRSAAIEVKFSEKTLHVRSTSPDHSLNIPLPYPVTEEACSARFDKSRQSLYLELTL